MDSNNDQPTCSTSYNDHRNCFDKHAEKAWTTGSCSGEECVGSGKEEKVTVVNSKRRNYKYQISLRSGELFRPLSRAQHIRSKSLSDIKHLNVPKNYIKKFGSVRDETDSESEDDSKFKNENVTETSPSGYKSFSRRKKLTLLCLALINFGSYLSMSIIAPFFPKEAELKGMTLSVTGYVFSLFALIQFLVSPIIGKFLPIVGVKFTFVAGIFLAAGCNILFGALNFIYDTTLFTAFCFILRGFEAVGSACFFTAACTIVAENFSEDVGVAYGLMETFMGIGMTAGPAIGGALYSLGGYELPFYTLGACLMLTVPISIAILPSLPGNVENKLSDSCVSLTSEEISTQSQIPTTFWKLLIIPDIIIISLIVMILCGIWGFLDPILEPHFRDFGVTPQTIGLLFLAMSGTYSITCPIIGKVSDKWGFEVVMMFIGLVTTALCLFLMGPATLFPFIPRTLSLNIVGLVLLGITIGVGLIPTFQMMLKSAYTRGFEENTVTFGLVSSMFSSASSLGEFVGPAIGGVLFENFSFDFASTLIAFVAIFIAAILIIHNSFKTRSKSKLDKDGDTPSTGSVSDSGICVTSETTPLLQHRSNSLSV